MTLLSTLRTHFMATPYALFYGLLYITIGIGMPFMAVWFKAYGMNGAAMGLIFALL